MEKTDEITIKAATANELFEQLTPVEQTALIAEIKSLLSEQ